MTNNNGPSTDPCGTPEPTSVSFELEPLTQTHCDRFVNQSVIQLNRLPRMP